jgi:uncharacterized membrane protein
VGPDLAGADGGGSRGRKATAGGGRQPEPGRLLNALRLQALHERLREVWGRLGNATKEGRPRLSGHLRWSRHVPLLVMMAIYSIHFGTVTVDMLRAYQQPAYDMAMPDQGIWLLSRFRDPFLTVAGRNLFGDHATFIYLLLVPVYWVYAHAAVLLVSQAIMISAAAVPIYLLARRLLGSTLLASLLAAAYLLNPAIQQPNLEQFHVEAFETPLLALAIYAAVVWRPRLLLVVAALILLCKEDAAVYVAPLAIWVFLRRDRAIGAATFGASVLAAGLDNLVVIPAFIGFVNEHADRIPFGNLSAAWRVALRAPGQFADYLASQGRLWYLWQMSFSAGVVFLVAPEIAVISALQLGVNWASSFGYQHQILYHYSMPIVPVLICGTIYAISRLAWVNLRRITTLVVALCALWSCVLWGAAPFSNHRVVSPATDTPALIATRHLLSEIPDNAVISAVQNFVPAIDHRSQVYMWPNPFHQVYYGNPKFDGRSWPVSSRVQYLLLPPCIRCDGGTSPWVSVFNQVIGKFRVVGRTSLVVLYERRAS